MRSVVLCLLLSLAISQLTNILLSNDKTVTVLSPSGYHVVNDDFLNTHRADRFGDGAKWVFLNGTSSSWPVGFKAQFQAAFNSDCSSAGKLKITADNVFKAVLNGV